MQGYALPQSVRQETKSALILLNGEECLKGHMNEPIALLLIIRFQQHAWLLGAVVFKQKEKKLNREQGVAGGVGEGEKQDWSQTCFSSIRARFIADLGLRVAFLSPTDCGNATTQLPCNHLTVSHTPCTL